MNSLQTRGRQFLSQSSHLGPVCLELDNKHFTTITDCDPLGQAFHANHLLSASLSPFCAGGSKPLQGTENNGNVLFPVDVSFLSILLTEDKKLMLTLPKHSLGEC